MKTQEESKLTESTVRSAEQIADSLTLQQITERMGIKLSASLDSEVEPEAESIPGVVEHPRDTQPFARKPQVKFIVILVLTSVAVGFFSLFLMQGRGEVKTAASPLPTKTPEYGDDKDREIAKLKAQISLQDQSQALAVTPSPTPTPSPSLAKNSAVDAPAGLPVTKAPVPVAAKTGLPSNHGRSYVNPTMEPTYRSRSIRNNASFVPYKYPARRPPTADYVNYNRPVRSLAPRLPTRAISPPISPLPSLESSESAKTPAPSSTPSESAKMPVPSPKPSPLISETRSIPQIEPVESPDPAPNPTPSPAVEIPIPALVIGSRVKGKSISPIQITQVDRSSEKSGAVLLIETSEPLLVSQGLQIPPGAIVAFNVTVASNGLVAGDFQGIWYRDRPVKVMGALTLEGEGDRPLLAQAVRPNGGSVARAENEAMLWGAIGQAGRVLSQPDSQISVNTGGSITTATSNNPNVLGAVLDGAFSSKAKARQQEAQQRREKARSESPIWYLTRGTEVVLTATVPDNAELVSAQLPVDSAEFQSASPIPSVDSRDAPLLLDGLPQIEDKQAIDPTTSQHGAIAFSTPVPQSTILKKSCETWGNRSSYPHVCN